MGKLRSNGAAVQGVHSINYYRSFGSHSVGTSATAVTGTHFYGQASLRNDLTDGILPDNRSGNIVGVFWRSRMKTLDSATNAKAIVDGLVAYQDADLKLYVNQVEVMRGPIWAFPSPPNWVQGTYSQGSAADNSTVSAQNGGYMLMAIQHEVGQRQRIQVRCEGTQAATITASTLLYEICLQIADIKAA